MWIGTVWDAAKHSETVIARGVLDISRLLDEVGDHKIVVILRALNKTEARLLFQELVRSLPPAMVADECRGCSDGCASDHAEPPQPLPRRG